MLPYMLEDAKEEQLLQAGALMSVTKDVLAWATGVQLDKGQDYQCLGCLGFEWHADTSPHLYVRCPQ